MKLQQLEFAVAIAELGSMTKASKRLMQAQPNVSIALKELEQELGFQIFDRSAAGMVPTAEGSAFLEKARAVVKGMEDLEREFSGRAEGRVSLRLAIAYSSYAVNAISSVLCEQGSRPYDVRIVEANTEQVLEDTYNGKFDLGMIRIPKESFRQVRRRIAARRIVHAVLMEYPLHVLISKEHPLAVFERIPVSELEKYPEMVYGSSDLGQARQLSLNPRQSSDHSRQRVCFFDRGTQISMMHYLRNAYLWTAPMSSHYLSVSNAVLRPCDYAVCRNMDILLWRAGAEDNAVLAEIIARIKAYAAEVAQELALTSE